MIGKRSREERSYRETISPGEVSEVLRCRKGFREIRKHGKAGCVKIKAITTACIARTTETAYRPHERFGPWTGLALFTICAFAASPTLALAAASAQASTEYPFYSSFGLGILIHPYGLSIDQSNGDFYVADVGSNRVYKFHSSGTLVTEFGSGGEIDGSGTPQSFEGISGIAVDNSGPSLHDFYVASSLGGVIDKFDSSGKYICQITGKGKATTSPSECDASDPTPAGSAGFSLPAGVAVDSEGNVYISEIPPSNIDVFNSGGRYLRSFHVQPGKDNSEPSGPASLAVDGAGNVYTADPDAPSGESLGGGAHVYDLAGGPNTTIGCPTTPTKGCPRVYTSLLKEFRGPGALRDPTGYPTSIAVDPYGEEMFVGDNTAIEGEGLIDRYNHAGEQLERFGQDASPPLSWNLSGIGVYGRTGQVYVSDTENGVIDVFGSPFARPVLASSPATDIERTQATLNGAVNPETAQLADCHFDYGLTSTYSGAESGTIPCLPAASSIPPDSTDHAVSADPSGLTPDTIYHFRLSVTTTDNVVIHGTDLTFTTTPNPPTATTDSASPITQTGAMLTATVNPQGATTEGAANYCRLEWGTDTTYSGGSAPCNPSPSWEHHDTAVSASVNSFRPDTLYHFQVVVKTPGGMVAGGDRTFTTLPDPPTASTGSASAISQTSATLGATVNPHGAATSGGTNSCRLEWWSGSGYSIGSAPCSPDLSGADTDTVVSADASGLVPSTLYHYWVVVSTAGGNAFGSEQAFMTKSRPLPPKTIKCKHGFRKVRVHGKAVCRKVRHRRRALRLAW